MRILYLTPGLFDKGGIARYGRYQVSALRDMPGKNSVDVLSLMAPAPGGLESPFSVHWHGPPSRLFGRSRMTWQALCRTFSRPDIVWSGHVNLSAMGLLLARLAGAKPVLNVYGLEVWSKKRFDAEFGLRRTPYIVSDCHFTADFVNREMPWSGRQTFVAWDCVDCERFTPGPCRRAVLDKYGLEANDGRFKVLTLGRISQFSRHKGWERLVTVASKLRDQNLVFIFAGEGDFRKELQDLVRREGLGDNFIFTGSVDEEDLVDIYRYCDLFSLVSDRGERRGEGLPLTPLEAAACGKPIVVGNHDGSQESVEDGRSGYVIDPFDLDGHAELIEKLSHDRDMAHSIGESARRRIVNNFSYTGFRDQTALIAQRIAQVKC